MKPNSRLAYSSEGGAECERCGKLASRCRCPETDSQGEPIPDRLTVRLRIEKSGRKGKTVTLVEGLPRNRDFLEDLARELKVACGSGGTAGSSHIEIQGDHRDRLRALLSQKGWRIED